MNYLFTICGRAGSKGAKAKNCRNFNGIPILHYSLAAATLFASLSSNDVVHICINTDSEQLNEIGRGWHYDIQFAKRDPEHAHDTSAKLPAIKDSLSQMEEKMGIKYECVVDLDITSPIRTVRHIADAVDKRASGDYDVVFSVAEARRNPYFNMVEEMPDGSCQKVIESTFTARQQAPLLYDMNASIYAWKPEFLRQNTTGLFLVPDVRCSFVEMQDTGILDIDSEWDFSLMEHIALFMKNHDKEIANVFELARSEGK